MNKVIILGNICKELELRRTPTNKSVVEFTIAVNEGYGEKRTTEYINCVAWEKNAENLCKYATKGTKLLIEGRFHTDTYEKDGKKFYKSCVVVNNFEMLSAKESNFDETGLPKKSEVLAKTNIEIKEDELPFY